MVTSAVPFTGGNAVSAAVIVAVPEVVLAVNVNRAVPFASVAADAGVIVPRVVETEMLMFGAGSVPDVMVISTSVWVVPFAGSRVRTGVTVTPSPLAMSVHTLFLQTKLGEPARQGLPSQLESLQSVWPLQSLSIPSLQLVSVVAVGGLGVQAWPVAQVLGAVEEHAPVPPPVRLHASPTQPGSAVQLVRHVEAIDPNLIVTEAVPAEPLAVTTASPTHPGVLPLQVWRTRVPLAPLTIVLLVPLDTNVPRVVVTVTEPLPVLVMVIVTVLVPFATTELAEAVTPT
jgi:hypothetical protein